MVAASELPINTVREGTTATDMANEIFGNGVTVTGNPTRATAPPQIQAARITSVNTILRRAVERMMRQR